MADIALICSRGFADVLTLGRQHRADVHAVHVGVSPWAAWLPQEMRFEVDERVGHDGAVVAPPGAVALEALGNAIAALPAPPRAFAVALLFAHRNPLHEQAVEALLRARFPQVPVTCSHRTDATGGEYERTLATVAAAGAAIGIALPALPAAAPPQAPQDAMALGHELAAIADAVETHMIGAAFSSVVREARDCAAALFLADGRLLAQANSLPLLLGSLAHAVAGICRVFPPGIMEEGDGYLTNDPWSGGTHLPDFVLLRPVCVAGSVRGMVCTILHQQDVGGITPGSVPTDATSVLQEGLRLPPLRLYRKGEPDPVWMAMLRANSRMPGNLAGDLDAQWTALETGVARFAATIARLGPAFDADAAALIEASAEATRAALAAVPDGDYAFRDALDGDGISPDPVAVEVCLVKRGAALTIDLTRCAPQTAGPVNASRAAVWAAVSYFARMLAPHAASNHGSTAPITLSTTPATIVDPAFPAAINARTNLVKMLANAFLGAWAAAAPERHPAPNAGVAVVLALSGRRPDGTTWMFTEIIASAAGGAPWGAGGSGVSTDVGNARNTPAETIETQAPLRVEQVALRRGSGGDGRHRGGDGVIRAYRLLQGEGTISYRGERHRIPAPGVGGGAGGTPGRAWIERGDGSIEQLPAKARARWQAGDRLVIETAGAGGWGTAVTSAASGAEPAS